MIPETEIDRHRMRAARENAGLSQDDAAKAICVTKNTIQNWESGRRRHIGGGHLLAAAEAYGVEPSLLLKKEGEAQPLHRIVEEVGAR